MAAWSRLPIGATVCFQTGVGLRDISQLASGNGWSAASITAHAGGTQALATPILSAVTLIAVCATAADSVRLPPAVGGQMLWITNAGAASARIFASQARTRSTALPTLLASRSRLGQVHVSCCRR